MNSSSLFFFSFSFFSIRGYNNPRFLTPAYSCLLLFLASALQLFLSLPLSLFFSVLFLFCSSPSLHFYSFLRIPVPSFRRALLIHSYSSSLYTYRLLCSLSLSLFFLSFYLLYLYRESSSLSPLLTPSFHACLRLSHVKLPSLLRSSFSPFPSSLSSFSLCFVSHIPLILRFAFHLRSRSCFRFRRFRALLSSSLSPSSPFPLSVHFPLYPLYRSLSTDVLFPLLAPLNYDRLARFISRRVPISSASFSFSTP